MDASLITQIVGVGTSADDELAYVECVFHDGSKSAVAFKPEMGSGVVVAFLAAYGHAQTKHAMRGGKAPDPMPIEISDLGLSYGVDGNGRKTGMLTASTKSGAEFHLVGSPDLFRGLSEKLERLIATLDSPPAPN